MGVRELRNAFNEAASPRYTCQRALSSYETNEAGEFEVLTFSGIGADGNGFEVRGEVPRGGDPVLIARATAVALLAKQEPLT